MADALNPVNQVLNPFNVGDPTGSAIQGSVELLAAGYGATSAAFAAGFGTAAAIGFGLPAIVGGAVLLGVTLNEAC